MSVGTRRPIYCEVCPIGFENALATVVAHYPPASFPGNSSKRDFAICVKHSIEAIKAGAVVTTIDRG